MKKKEIIIKTRLKWTGVPFALQMPYRRYTVKYKHAKKYFTKLKRNSARHVKKKTVFPPSTKNYLILKFTTISMQNKNNFHIHKIEYGHLLDKSRASLFDVQLRLTLSVTLTGVAVGAGGSGAKSKNPIGTPTILKFTIFFYTSTFKLNHAHNRFSFNALKKI